MNRLDDALRGGQKMCSANVATATVEAWIFFQNVIFHKWICSNGFENTLNGQSSALPGGNKAFFTKARNCRTSCRRSGLSPMVPDNSSKHATTRTMDA